MLRNSPERRTHTISSSPRTVSGSVWGGDSALAKISVSQGHVDRICSCPGSRGATWLADGTIVLGAFAEGLQRVPAAGGAPTQITTLADGELDHRWPQILPDQKHLLFTAQTRTETRITNTGFSLQPLWSLDGSRIIYALQGDGLYWQLARIGAAPELFLDRVGMQLSLSWTPTGQLLFAERAEATGFDVLELNLEDGSVKALLATDFNEYSAAVSLDQRWLAYVSDETGRKEVYLQKYAGSGNKLRISLNGGTEPVWSKDGTELFFRNGPDFYSVGVSTNETNPIGQPDKLFSGPYVPSFTHRPNYDVSEDGRFVLVDGDWGLTKGRLDIFLGFSEVISRLVPIEE